MVASVSTCGAVKMADGEVALAMVMSKVESCDHR